MVVVSFDGWRWPVSILNDIEPSTSLYGIDKDNKIQYQFEPEVEDSEIVFVQDDDKEWLLVTLFTFRGVGSSLLLQEFEEDFFPISTGRVVFTIVWDSGQVEEWTVDNGSVDKKVLLKG